MHSAHSNIKCDIMNKYLANFYLCGGCSHRESHEDLKDGEFFGSSPNSVGRVF